MREIIVKGVRFLNCKIQELAIFKIKIIRNVFKKKNSKTVLISFIISPFQSEISFSHTNQNECYFAAKFFDELGYNVDVVNYNQKKIKINYSEYEILYGFGEPIENYYLKYKKDKTGPKVILYLNGSYLMYSNLKGALRVKNVYQVKGFFLPYSARISNVNWTWSHHMADALIVLGNETIAETYKELRHQNISSLNAFFYKNKNINIGDKDYNIAKKNYLWFGSSGSIHKGLDLVLEYFLNHPELELHVCGIQEQNFEYLHEMEFKKLNIHNHGCIDIYGDTFVKLMMLCGFCVFPSVSEGGGVSVLTCLGNGGLIPIISKSTGLDVDEFGFIIDEISLLSLSDAMEASQRKSNDELKILSENVQYEVSKIYSIDNYCIDLKKIIQKNI